MVNITIRNLPQIRSAFRKAPFEMSKNLNLAIQKTIFQVSAQSKRNTPVRTGRLRASTYTRFDNLRGEVGTNAEYDIFVHEGTRFMKARPYLRSAVESEDNKIQDYFKKAVQDTLDTIARAV